MHPPSERMQIQLKTQGEGTIQDTTLCIVIIQMAELLKSEGMAESNVLKELFLESHCPQVTGNKLLTHAKPKLIFLFSFPLVRYLLCQIVKGFDIYCPIPF